MILVNGDSFTAGEESTLAWPDLVLDTVNIATPGAGNDHIVSSTIIHIETHANIDRAIIAWTTPHRITIGSKHLTPTSQKKYGKIVDEVFCDWDESWAWQQLHAAVSALHGYLEYKAIPHIFVSTFGIPANTFRNCMYWLDWGTEGMVEWMSDCPKGLGGHPLELGHQRIARKINEHIRSIGWIS